MKSQKSKVKKRSHRLEIAVEYLSFVNAVLGGFAFAFLGALITLEKSSRILTTTFIVTAAAAGCFLIATLGSTLTSSMIDAAQSGQVSEDYTKHFAYLNRPISLTFIFGVFFLTISVGLMGWIRTRYLGIATTVIALFTGFGAMYMIRPFIR